MISAKQKKILAYPYSKYDALICDGAVRSGKTSIMMWAYVRWAMENFSGQRFGVCGRTVDSCTKNIIVPFTAMSLAKERYIVRWRRGDKVMEVRRGAVTNYFEVFGGKDEASYTLIQGRTLAGVLLDEVVLMPRSFVEQALARCSVDGARLWFSCNPGSPHHWFYQEWIKRSRERNALYLHFEMTDNPGLSKRTLERYENMYAGIFYDRYVRGLWVAAEGIVYKDFANDTEKYLIGDPLEWAKQNGTSFSIISIGVDFGGTKSATKFQATGITKNFRVVALEEEYIKNEEIDPDALNRRFATFCQLITSKYGYSQTRADSAETVLIRGLDHTAQKLRLGTQVKNALKMQITDRIRLVVLLMKQGRFKVSRNCPHLIDALQSAIYDPDKFEDERLDDGTSDIDSLDAFEYSIEPYYKDLERAGHMMGR
jgi:PBSX family phage terminase large subunit|nr:MAG TPA: large terminase [Caudoviricetes sp.]DAN82297.1 MAG TPA: large terminase [Caudoviricetes sp.]DAV27864.1 MAG TPA: large terminase [Caudoviricetes sp.]